MTTLKHIREATGPERYAVSLNIKIAYSHIPIAGRHCCLLGFRQRSKVYQLRTLSFILFTALNTFTRVTKPILLQCWKMGTAVFLYLADTLVLGNSYTQIKEDGQRLGFC